MSVLAILLILALGYERILRDRGDYAILRRTSGWESYSYLAHAGVGQFFVGVIVSFILLLAAYLLLATFSGFGRLFSPLQWLNYMAHLTVFAIPSPLFAFFFFAWVSIPKAREGALNDKERIKIRNIDSISELSITALERNMPLRVNLKSGKVYIGMMVEEQFERVDKDHLMMIPYMSGFRTKETGQMVLDCSYIDLYEKKQILSNTDKMLEFRSVIRLNEVESISLFDFSLRQEFSYDLPHS